MVCKRVHCDHRKRDSARAGRGFGWSRDPFAGHEMRCLFLDPDLSRVESNVVATKSEQFAEPETTGPREQHERAVARLDRVSKRDDLVGCEKRSLGSALAAAT